MIECGIQTSAEIDAGKLIIARSADVSPIIDDVKQIKSVTDGKSKSGDMYHLGRIPAIVIEQYLNQHGVTYRDFLQDRTHINRILNDPDYAAFRVWEGQV
jgi:hypothetical protein